MTLGSWRKVSWLLGYRETSGGGGPGLGRILLQIPFLFFRVKTSSRCMEVSLK